MFKYCFKREQFSCDTESLRLNTRIKGKRWTAKWQDKSQTWLCCECISLKGMRPLSEDYCVPEEQLMPCWLSEQAHPASSLHLILQLHLLHLAALCAMQVQKVASPLQQNQPCQFQLPSEHKWEERCRHHHLKWVCLWEKRSSRFLQW